KVFSVVVMGAPDARQSVTSVSDLLLDTPSGGWVRLGDVADVTIARAPDLIKHDAVSRRIDVTVHVQGRARSDVLRDVQQRLQRIAFPMEFHAEVLTDYDAQQDVQMRLIGAAIAVLIALFLLLQTAFGSWRLATLAFCTLPLALVGGGVIVYATGGV